ncbi:hypothetical protein ACFL0Y_00410 [Patescibacteria group bacterium]
MANQKIGTITHYFDRIGVAVINVLAPIKVGDKIKVVGGGNEFEQKIESMQVEHENIDKAKKGDDVGMKVDQEAGKGDEVFKVT